jgi:addiction module RelE/StbE family toxin
VTLSVRWTLEALQDRADVWDYLSERNPVAAARIDALFSAAAGRLSVHPQMGRTGLIAGTREVFAHENYRLVYEVVADEVWILALVHVARLWPPVT